MTNKLSLRLAEAQKLRKAGEKLRQAVLALTADLDPEFWPYGVDSALAEWNALVPLDLHTRLRAELDDAYIKASQRTIRALLEDLALDPETAERVARALVGMEQAVDQAGRDMVEFVKRHERPSP